MSYVLKSTTGLYLTGRGRWDMVLTEDLQKARVYPTKGAATVSRNGLMGSRRANLDAASLVTTPVQLTEAPT